MAKGYDRTYEYELVSRLGEYDVEPSELLQHCLSWMSADDSCAMLEAYFKESDLPLPGEKEEE